MVDCPFSSAIFPVQFVHCDLTSFVVVFFFSFFSNFKPIWWSTKMFHWKAFYCWQMCSNSSEPFMICIFLTCIDRIFHQNVKIKLALLKFNRKECWLEVPMESIRLKNIAWNKSNRKWHSDDIYKTSNTLYYLINSLITLMGLRNERKWMGQIF